MNLTVLLKQLLGILVPLLPFLGQGALAVAERSVTIPEADVRKMMGKAPEEKIQEAIKLGHTFADAFSDFAVYVASHGQIDPD